MKALCNWVREVWADGIGSRLILLMVGLGIASVPLAFWMAVEARKRWDRFAEEHHCKVVSRMAGDVSFGTGVGLTPDGKVGTISTTTVTTGKTGWLCDDGIVYWR